MRKTVVGMLITLLIFPLGAHAQEESRLDGTTPRVETSTVSAPNLISKAALRQVNRLMESRPTAAARSQQSGPTRSWLARHPVLAGFLIGAGAGAAFGAATNANSGCFDSGASPCPGVYAAMNAGLFGGIGALVGLAW